MSVARRNQTATLLPNGKVLVAGGQNTNGHLSTAEIYNPASGGWTSIGSMLSARAYHTASLLPNGQVLVAGGVDNIGAVPTAEVYDPSTGTWRETNTLSVARAYHTATVLPDGGVLLAGGLGNYGFVGNADIYHVDLGCSNAWRPQVITFTSPLPSGGSLALTGTCFRGVSEGSGGTTINSPGDHPVVQLRSIENGQVLFPDVVSWSTNTYTSAAISGFPFGYALATVFVNGIPSESVILNVGDFCDLEVAPIYLREWAKAPGGGFRFAFTNLPEFTFTVLAATNLALPASNWNVLGAPTEVSAGRFEFNDPDAATMPQRFYRVRSP